MELQEKYYGSTIVIILGVFSFIGGLGTLGSLPTDEVKAATMIGAGLSIFFGALAYRSVKRRKLLTVTPSVFKIIFEIICLLLAMLPVLIFMGMTENEFQRYTAENPSWFLWVGILIAYFVVLLIGKKE